MTLSKVVTFLNQGGGFYGGQDPSRTTYYTGQLSAKRLTVIAQYQLQGIRVSYSFEAGIRVMKQLEGVSCLAPGTNTRLGIRRAVNTTQLQY